MNGKLVITIVLTLSVFVGAHAQHSASFSAEYRSTMQDSVTYEIPEICELFHAVAALTPFGKGETDIIDKSTAYYQDVLEYFKAYQEHSVIKKIQKESYCLLRNSTNASSEI